VNIRALVAEAVGTFILLTFGLLGVATNYVLTDGQGNQLLAILVIPFCFGLGLLAAIALAGHASGGHFNPAVTLAALFDGRVTWQSAIGYVIAQIVGAFAACLLILLSTSRGVIAMGVNQPGPTDLDLTTRELHAFAVEVVLTAIFVAVILTATRKLPDLATLIIPLVLVAIHYAGIFISGASVNPVRSLAPAVVSGTYESLWVYVTAPFAGAVLGWAVYRFLTPPDDEVSVEVEEEFDEDDLEDLDEEDDQA
jgi:MIP family channel proteins